MAFNTLRYGRDVIEKCAKIYPTTTIAAQALGIAASSFNRYCNQFGIETPGARNRREKKEARGGPAVA